MISDIEMPINIEESKVHPSIHQDGDKYDRLGRNVSAQERREKLYGVWTQVVYRKTFY